MILIEMGIRIFLLGGNFYQSKPEIGIYDASYGLCLKVMVKEVFSAVKANQSGFFIKGAIRDIIDKKRKKTNDFNRKK